MKKAIAILIVLLLATGLAACGPAEPAEPAEPEPEGQPSGAEYEILYRFPAEDSPHEGTWLCWPHDRSTVEFEMPEGSTSYRDDMEDAWVAMTKALHTGEIVHIIAYNEEEQAHIEGLLTAENVDMSQIDFFLCETDDVWVRDTGPIFVLDEDGQPVIANFTFNGWGGKQEATKDNAIPQAVADAYGFDIVQIPELVLEGGAVDVDGAGTLMASKSSIINKNRNPGKSQEEIESILSKYLGIENFLWIKGSAGEDITDAHIDGTARFINDHQIFICSKREYAWLFEHDPDRKDWLVFENAKNARGEDYELVHLPLTRTLLRSYGKNLGYYGMYVNYYIGNEVVLVPQYGDDNDELALEIIGKAYPGREIVGIDCSKIVYYGGMVHCVAQQQPMPGNTP